MRSQAAFLHYTNALEAEPEAPARAWAKFAELCARHGKRGAVAGNLALLQDVAGATETLRGQRDTTAEGIELRAMSEAEPDPFPGAGWPVLALTVTPRLLTQLMDDRRVAALVYVPRTRMELSHLQRAFADAVGI